MFPARNRRLEAPNDRRAILRRGLDLIAAFATLPAAAPPPLWVPPGAWAARAGPLPGPAPAAARARGDRSASATPPHTAEARPAAPAPHPHRRPLGAHGRHRRPGAVAAAVQPCLTPLPRRAGRPPAPPRARPPKTGPRRPRAPPPRPP